VGLPSLRRRQARANGWWWPISAFALLGPQARTKIQKARQDAEVELLRLTHHEREEAARQRKAEKLKAQQEAYKRMTPEQQRRQDAKEYMKTMRKRAGSMMKLVRG